jgi:hypothetical protein
MIDVNQSRKAVLNLEDDGWESELDRTAIYLTKFNTHQTTSSDEEIGSSSSESSQLK